MDNQKQLISESGFCELLREVCMIAAEKNVNALTEDIVSDLFNDINADSEVKVCPCLLGNENGYDAALPLLENTFLDDDKKNEFRKTIACVKDLRNGLISGVTEQRPFPSFTNTVKYLDEYYNLLKQILHSFDLLKDSGAAGKDFIQKIVNIDMMLSCDPAYISFYSPLVLDGLVHVYGAVVQYGISVADLQSSRCRKDYQEVLVSKVLRYFNWNIAEDNRLLRASIPASYSKKLENMRQTLKVPVRPMKEWDSYEGIGELRLLDKILYEADQRPGQTEFHVAFIGDIEYEPMNQLCSLVDFSLQNNCNRSQKELHVFLHVLTKNELTQEKIENGLVQCEFEAYHQQLQQASTVKNLVEKNDAIFILDSSDLYTPLTVVPKDKGYILQLFGKESYLKDYYCTSGGNELSREGGFAGLIEALHTFCYAGRLGWLTKSLNQGLLQYLEKYLPKRKGTSIYLYISDLAAFQTVDCDENQIIRIEQYNDKQIAIMRISDLKEEALPTGKLDSDRIIVFTLWQLVKHIAVRDIDDFLSFF